MTTTTESATARTLYDAFCKLLYRHCHQYRRRYGGDWDDWLSAAHVGYARAVDTGKPEFDSRRKVWVCPSHGVHFSTWLHWCVESQLRKEVGRRVREAQRRAVTRDNSLRGCAARPRFRLRRLLFELSDDAAHVVGLLLERPEPLPSSKRKAVVGLLAELGWCGRQVVAAFSEIRAALSE